MTRSTGISDVNHGHNDIDVGYPYTDAGFATGNFALATIESRAVVTIIDCAYANVITQKYASGGGRKAADNTANAGGALSVQPRLVALNYSRSDILVTRRNDVVISDTGIRRAGRRERPVMDTAGGKSNPDTSGTGRRHIISLH